MNLDRIARKDDIVELAYRLTKSLLFTNQSGRWDSNPRHSAWEADVKSFFSFNLQYLQV